ncbi:LPS-assembly protein LptD, partial [Helicobacter pylori]
MIYWLYLAVFFLLSALEAKEIAMQRFDKQNHKIFEILADKVSAKDNVITASGNAILLNYDVYILADKVRYDTKTKEALLEGNIKVYRGEGLLVKTDYVKLSLNEKYEIIFPFYVQDSVSGIWVSADIASGKDQKYKVKNMSASGCSIDNPIWHVNATSGSFNMQKSHLSMWNPKIYVG